MCSEKIRTIMLSMGCKESGISGMFTHPDFNFDFDLSATHEDKVLFRLAAIISEIGYAKCQSDFRELLGLG